MILLLPFSIECESHYIRLIANGYCDDVTNTMECEYDGGDCCGICINTEYCFKCECLEDEYEPIWYSVLLGNGYCNDGLNKKECLYDGGDCCGLCINTVACTKCECLEEVGKYNVVGPMASWIGNGFCDDELNKVECNFDAGDCCGPNVKTESCDECQCLYNGTLFGKEWTNPMKGKG